MERVATLDFYEAEGRFVGPRRLRLDGTELEAERIFLVTGTRTAIPPIDGLGRVPYLTSRTLLDLRELPEHLVVVGGGYIGCEFAQMFRRFGSRVTVVQRAERLLPSEDPEVSAAVAQGFADDGIEVRTGTTCVAVDRQESRRVRLEAQVLEPDLVGVRGPPGGHEQMGALELVALVVLAPDPQAAGRPVDVRLSRDPRGAGGSGRLRARGDLPRDPPGGRGRGAPYGREQRVGDLAGARLARCPS